MESHNLIIKFQVIEGDNYAVLFPLLRHRISSFTNVVVKRYIMNYIFIIKFFFNTTVTVYSFQTE